MHVLRGGSGPDIGASESHFPQIGEVVVSRGAVSRSFNDSNGNEGVWSIAANEPAIIVAVGRNGDFKLQNPCGLVSDWLFWGLFVFLDQATEFDRGLPQASASAHSGSAASASCTNVSGDIMNASSTQASASVHSGSLTSDKIFEGVKLIATGKRKAIYSSFTSAKLIGQLIEGHVYEASGVSSPHDCWPRLGHMVPISPTGVVFLNAVDLYGGTACSAQVERSLMGNTALAMMQEADLKRRLAEEMAEKQQQADLKRRVAEEKVKHIAALTRKLRQELAEAEELERIAESELQSAVLEVQDVNESTKIEQVSEITKSAHGIREGFASQPPNTFPTVRPDEIRGRMQWQAPDGTFQDYDAPASLAIRTWQLTCNTGDGVREIEVTGGGRTLKVRSIGGHKLEQQVVGGSGRWRPVRWVGSEDVPEPSWTPQVCSADFVHVEPQTSDYVRVINLAFYDGPGTLRERLSLVKIERVQNQLLKIAYEAAKKQIILRRGAANLNEKMLFHGTGKSDPYQVAGSGEGLMIEHAKEKAFYGKGMYFAAKPQYAMSGRYPHQTLSPERIECFQVLICSVLCGSMRDFGTEVDLNLSRKTLPASDYDSTTGGPHRPGAQGPGDGRRASIIHVVYNGVQIYPEFVLTVRRRVDDEPFVEAPDLAG